MTETETQDVTFWARVVEAFGTDNASEISRRISRHLRHGSISQQAVSRWKNPNSFPSLEILCAIQDTTGVVIYWLARGEGEKYVKPAEQIAREGVKPDVDPETNQILRLLAQHDPATRAEIKKLIADRLASIPNSQAPTTLEVISIVNHLIPIRFFGELTATGTLGADTTSTLMVDESLLRGHAAADCYLVRVSGYELATDGVNAGNLLLCAPVAALRPGSLVIARLTIPDLPPRLVLRNYYELNGRPTLEDRQRINATLYPRPEECELLHVVLERIGL